jgi:hypothetical protein
MYIIFTRPDSTQKGHKFNFWRVYEAGFDLGCFSGIFGFCGYGLYIEQVGTGTANENIRIQSSKSGDETNYSQFIVDPTSGFSFIGLGSGNASVRKRGNCHDLPGF